MGLYYSHQTEVREEPQVGLAGHKRLQDHVHEARVPVVYQATRLQCRRRISRAVAGGGGGEMRALERERQAREREGKGTWSRMSSLR